MRIYLLVSVTLLQLLTFCASEKQKGVVEWIKAPDAKTGYEVWQMTNHDSASVAVYFENQAFTSDDRFVVFGSSRSGKWEIYRADLSNGGIVALTKKMAKSPVRFTVHPDGKHIYYIHNQVLFKTNVATGDEESTFDFSSKFSDPVRFSSSFTADAKYTLISTRSDSGQSIYRVNLETGDVKHVLTRKQGRISHPLICPTNPDLVTFVPGPDTQNDMSLPMEKRARTWIVNVKTGEEKQFLTMPYGFRATHESWSLDGKRFFFYKKSVPDWIPVSICSIDQDGGNFTEYYTHNEIRLGHGISSADGKWFVSDGQDPDYNPLVLLNLETGKATFLCWSNSSIRQGHSRHAHVHPSLSSSGRYACYTSDVTGTAQVYVVPIPDNILNQ